MDPLVHFLHPNPGWSDSPAQASRESHQSSSKEHVGKHLILELYDCDQFKLNDEAFVRTTITSSAKLAGATLINLITHRFEPQGITGLALLAESHISIHTWPEIGYAAIDVFTCGNHTMPEEACFKLKKEFVAKKYLLKHIQREMPIGLSSSLRNPTAN